MSESKTRSSESKTWSLVNRLSLCGILLLVLLIVGLVRTQAEVLLEEELEVAAGDGDLTTVKILVNIGVDVDGKNTEWGGTPVSAAVRYGRDEVVTYLLDHHADITRAPYQRK